MTTLSKFCSAEQKTHGKTRKVLLRVPENGGEQQAERALVAGSGLGRVASQERLVLERRQALHAQKIILKDFANFRE